MLVMVSCKDYWDNFLKLGLILQESYKLEQYTKVNSVGVNCMLYPEALREEVVWTDICMTHSNARKTYERLRSTQYWPKMTCDMRRIVTHCNHCQHSLTRSLNQRERLDDYSQVDHGKE